MTYNSIQTVFFIGIGGIGMSAIANYFKDSGKEVFGYDKTPTKITEGLQKKGITVSFDESDIESIVALNKSTTLVVYTPAVPIEIPIYQYLKEKGFTIKKRAEVLSDIVKTTFSIAVAGTHGKTTVSTIIAYILRESGKRITAFLGGVSENYDSNYFSSGNDITVVEADEYDRSFLQLNPNIACIMAVDADHMDIYGSPSQLKKSFELFASKVERDGLFVRENLFLKGHTFGFEEPCDYRAKNLRFEGFVSVFDMQTPHQTIKNIRLPMLGRHNVINALAAIAICLEKGVLLEDIKRILAGFKGIKRRFSCQIDKPNLVFIDDYAHHPKEIDAIYNTICLAFPGRKSLVVFQPHLFSRTKDFENEFAESLSNFDYVALLEIYPARELPIEGISSKNILDKITHQQKQMIGKQDIVNHIKSVNPEIVITLGAGDIGEEVQQIKKALL